VVHPERPERIWVASAGGGVWHTSDGGEHWAPVDDRMANLACACIAMDPSTPETMYVGTGEGFSNNDAMRGDGIFRTTDGVTWRALPATADRPDFRLVNRIAVGRSGRVVLAATASGIWRSDDAAREHWTQVLPGRVADVRFDATNEMHGIAGAMRDGAAWYTRDGGLNWLPASHDPWSGRVELTYSARDPNVVYASVQMSFGEIWRSTDGGLTYQRRANLIQDNGSGAAGDPLPAPYLGTQGWYDNAIWAGDPTDSDLLIVGGINLWRSTDGGDTLAEISTWKHPSSVHADHHAIVSHPAFDGVTNRTVFFTNDGGCAKGRGSESGRA
jgi:photosystem II stability/assembly factor-like uncharacterized protein